MVWLPFASMPTSETLDHCLALARIPMLVSRLHVHCTLRSCQSRCSDSALAHLLLLQPSCRPRVHCHRHRQRGCYRHRLGSLFSLFRSSCGSFLMWGTCLSAMSLCSLAIGITVDAIAVCAMSYT